MQACVRDELESLVRRPECERIAIQGWRFGNEWRWIVDVVTDLAAGHGNEGTLVDAIAKAVDEIRESERWPQASETVESSGGSGG